MRSPWHARSVYGVNLHPHVVTSALDARHNDLVRQARPSLNEEGSMHRLSRRRLALGGLALAAAAIAVTAVVAQAGTTKHYPSAAQTLRHATARYHDTSVAESAGYSLLRDAQNIACIDNQPMGGMGMHFINGPPVGDNVLGREQPEVWASNSRRLLQPWNPRVHC
jgi:hypothetical protein